MIDIFTISDYTRHMERKPELINDASTAIKNIAVQFKTTDDRKKFEEYLERHGLKAGPWVRVMIMAKIAEEEGK